MVELAVDHSGDEVGLASELLPVSLTMVAVGLLESLLTAQIVDDMTDTESDKRRECIGQGSAKMAVALVGGMSGCAINGQSVINVSLARPQAAVDLPGALLLFLLVALGRLVR